MARTLLFNSMINLRVWSWQQKQKKNESKSSKLQATVYYIHTCQFPKKRKAASSKLLFITYIHVNFRRNEKQQAQSYCLLHTYMSISESIARTRTTSCESITGTRTRIRTVLAAGATVSTLFYSVSTYMNNTYFSNSIGALSVTRYTWKTVDY